MQTLAHTSDFTIESKNTGILSRFMNWSTLQQKNRLLWIGLALAIQGCVLAPITLFVVALNGNEIILWALTASAMTVNLVVNLAALPTKITVPTFFFTLVLNIGIITYSLL